MTHEKFWDLWVNKACKFKMFVYNNPDADNGELAMEKLFHLNIMGNIFLDMREIMRLKGIVGVIKMPGGQMLRFASFRLKKTQITFSEKCFPNIEQSQSDGEQSPGNAGIRSQPRIT